MLTSTSFGLASMAWVGAIILLLGEIAALLSLRSLPRLIVVSTIAEAGYVLLGFGLGNAAGDTGAFMHLGYQAVMRGLLVRQVAMVLPATDRVSDSPIKEVICPCSSSLRSLSSSICRLTASSSAAS